MRIAVVAVLCLGCDKGPAPPTGVIRGRVSEETLGGPNDHGTPQASVQGRECTVHVLDASGSPRASTRTNGLGEFELSVPLGRYKVSFTACGGPTCISSLPTVTDVELKRAGEEVRAEWFCAVQKPAVAPPHGTIKGTATIAMSGPGRYHRPEESFTRTSGIDCTVKATDTWGQSHEVKTKPESGEFEMGVPAGRYDVSFEACASHSGCSGRAERIQQVEVSPDAPAEVSWTCELSAK